MTETLITLSNPRSRAAEAYQSLRTNIEFSSLQRTLKSLLVTCADVETDSGHTLANLAVVMAQAGAKVLVVDGDLRRPQQHEIFGLANQAGLSTWLADGGTPPIQDTPVKGLRVLTAGPAVANPIALISANRLADALAQLAPEADYILCDAPPILAVTDAALWAAKVDGVVLAINAGKTKREQAQRAKALLEKVNAHIVGAILLNASEESGTGGYYGA
ncbi:MAG: CpsD/CapB family tyrosine-protein kinase [Caldilineaceae bacterium]|nr:CpsD/CapB family tyrosine-protein kinase [Caldilineaceae bacterium]MBP8107137.1 CpsD/CapB family tyrosine-protein kinase [Caldilineaceae bacterium]MBP8121481.1 CpsD/CapB family tyrosine-protein kinase [Caldilineaceae bacterium]MBP9074079.1 CpsD/CapB family tyrosine-protein kinase [Caldilineaceae bacterium]